MLNLSHSGFHATISTRGAELQSLKGPDGTEFIWQADPRHWGKHAPVLFPIVGTLRNNQYTFKDKTYQLPRHGFARELDFKAHQVAANQATFTLQANEFTRSVYPFAFELRIGYTLNQNVLSVDYTVCNLNDFTMPFALGAHPAFNLPGDFSGYSLSFSNDEMLHFFALENDLLGDQPNTLPLNDGELQLKHDIFANDALVFKQFNSDKIKISKHRRPFLEVGFQRFPHLGLWTKPTAPFLCIEPWLGYADTVNASGNILEKEAITLLEAGGNFETNMRISIL